MLKVCTKCHEPKGLSDFHKDKHTKDGLTRSCAICRRQTTAHWRSKNPGKVSEYTKANLVSIKRRSSAWNAKNKNRVNASARLNYEKNKQRRRQIALAWQKRNPGKCNAARAYRHTLKLKRTPGWLTKDQKKEIRSFYEAAAECRWLSAEPLEVDHIIPLKGLGVSGLHVPWNLQILTASANIKKSNKLILGDK